ncbi:MAG: hypothetical protein HYV04_06035 [Deltaproteobacteria bacterium]|nr:hypothetical protein [Deltaproteobacteria bacterium]
MTVATYGGLTDVVEEAMERLLLEMEIEFDYFVVTQLYPLELGDVLESVARTKRFVFVEEGVKSFGVGAEVVATLLEADRQFCCRRVGAADVPIPCARQLEQQVLPSAQRVLEAIVDVLNDG